jgi:hypothetical protein
LIDQPDFKSILLPGFRIQDPSAFPQAFFLIFLSSPPNDLQTYKDLVFSISRAFCAPLTGQSVGIQGFDNASTQDTMVQADLDVRSGLLRVVVVRDPNANDAVSVRGLCAGLLTHHPTPKHQQQDQAPSPCR